MKIALYEKDGKTSAGIVDEKAETVTPCRASGDLATDGVATLISQDIAPDGEAVPLSAVKLLAPIPRPRRNIFCVGKNYYDHAHEFANSGFDSSAAAGAVPQAPIIFSKVPESVIATGENIRMDPTVSTAVDYEVELAVIIGKEGRNISKEDALDHVWGYTIVNDVTARDLQGLHSQWLIGKSQDTFCPMGPWVVTADEFKLEDATVRCWVNDELRQDSNTKLLIFDVPTTIAALSNGITLRPGDVIATGTPAGVGIGYKPPKYLVDGDVVRQAIGGIGAIENTIVSD